MLTGAGVVGDVAGATGRDAAGAFVRGISDALQSPAWVLRVMLGTLLVVMMGFPAQAGAGDR